MTRSCVLLTLLFTLACSSNKQRGSDATAGDGSGAMGGMGASGGSGGSGAMGGGGGTGGADMTPDGTGGAMTMDSGTQADAGKDAGNDAGPLSPQPTRCKAPLAAQNAGNTCPATDPAALKATLVKGSLSVPLFVTHAPADTARLFVVERAGRISILDAANFAELGDFIDVQNVATSTGANDERGLLGLAFHPDYPIDPRFFVNYTTTSSVGALKTVISSFEVSSDPSVAKTDSEQVLFDFAQPASNHNGGMLAFGTDGCLFVGAGDGGKSNDIGTGHAPGGNGQSLATPLGKILRLDVDAPMTAAPGNLAGASVPQIWDYGMRNPFRFSFDRLTGDLYIGDVGQDTWEEVDVEAAGAGNKNYGWPIAEGDHCRPGNTGCTAADLVGLQPVVDEYEHQASDDCVIGGFVYRGKKIPSLQGWYVYGDNGSGTVRALVWDGESRCNDKTLDLSARDGLTFDADITSFGEGGDGELYITTSKSVYLIEAK